MSRVCVLTPNPVDASFFGRWREVFDRMAGPLNAVGINVEGRPWSEAGDLSGFDLVLPLTVWGYHRDHALWLEAVDGWRAQDVALANPARVLHWNSDKSYLGRLAEAGAPVVPTIYVDQLTTQAMDAAAEAFGVQRLVAKPRVSAGAHRTLLWSPGDGVEAGPEGAAMIQPFLASVASSGETSLFFFQGEFSHAVGKVAQGGDFRVQPEYGGLISAVTPAQDELAAAERVLAAVGEPLLYARIDLVRDLDGRPALIEAELIEPDLYLGYAPDRGQAFARAVRRVLDGGPA